MGAQASVTDLYTNMCGMSSQQDKMAAEAQANHSVQKRGRYLKAYVEIVMDFDRRIENKRLRIEDYAKERGKLLYLFYVKMFAIQDKFNDTNSLNLSSNNNSSKQKFDLSSIDPFKKVYPEYRGMTIKYKRVFLENLWDILLGNQEDINNKLSRTDTNDQFQIAAKSFSWAKWDEANALERKVYLLRFCTFAGPDLDKMDDFNEMDLINTYKDSDATLRNMMKENSFCVVL